MFPPWKYTLWMWCRWLPRRHSIRKRN